MAATHSAETDSRLAWSVAGERSTRPLTEDPMSFDPRREVEIVATIDWDGEQEETAVPREPGWARDRMVERLSESDAVLLRVLEMRLAQRNARIDSLAKTEPAPAYAATGTDDWTT